MKSMIAILLVLVGLAGWAWAGSFDMALDINLGSGASIPATPGDTALWDTGGDTILWDTGGDTLLWD